MRQTIPNNSLFRGCAQRLGPWIGSVLGLLGGVLAGLATAAFVAAWVVVLFGAPAAGQQSGDLVVAFILATAFLAIIFAPVGALLGSLVGLILGVRNWDQAARWFSAGGCGFLPLPWLDFGTPFAIVPVVACSAIGYSAVSYFDRQRHRRILT